MAFKIAGSMAFKQAMEQAEPVLLEPIMLVTVMVPEDVVGDVVGDLNSRRGRPLGMEAKGLRDGDQGRGADGRGARLSARPAADHRRSRRLHDGFARHEEIPSHLAQKVISEARAEEEVRA